MPKDPELYEAIAGNRNGVHDILYSPDADHARIRRLLNHAFSDAALKKQEHLLNDYFSLLIRKLHQKISSPAQGKVDFVRWYNFTTFDIIGDLAFGEPFDALQSEEYHFWIAQIFGGVKLGRIFRILRAYPIVGTWVFALQNLVPSIARAMYKHRSYAREKTERRMEKDVDRQDFMR